MKNFMKKIIIVSLAFVFLLIGTKVSFASGPFNGQSGDCPGLTIGNYTTGDGIANGQWNCWTNTSVTASAGDTINVSLFYHNNTNSTLTNVKASLTQSSSGPAGSYSFNGTIYSSQGNTSLGTVYLNLGSNQTLTYSSAHWMKDKNAIDNDTDSTMLYGQGSNVMNNGNQISLGSVPSGWDDYGQIIVVFKVGTNNFINNNNNNNYYRNNNCQINNFSASDTNIDQGDSTILYWNTSGCDHVNITNLGSVNSIGSDTVSPSYDTTYTLKAYDQNGLYQSMVVNIYVDQNNYNNNNNCTISSFRANSSTNIDINQGDRVNLYWNTNDCDSVTVSGPNFYSNDFDGNESIYPSYSGTYTLKAYDYNGSIRTKTVYVDVNNNYYNSNPVIYNSCAVTTLATNIGQNYATLNGLVTNSNNTNTYFEYGTSVNLGSVTNARNVSGNSQLSETLNSLAPNTIYFFRLVANCNSGTSYGKVEIFKTLGSQIITQKIVTQGKTIIGTSSPVMLKIENKYEAIGVGDTVDYTVTYKNISKMKLVNPVLQVVAPKDIVLNNSSKGTYDKDTNTLTVLLDDLMPGDEGNIYIEGKVDSISAKTAKIVTTAILVYTTPNKAQENAIAYILNIPKNFGSNSLGAAALFGGIMNLGLIGWLILIILILIIIILSRSIYNKKVVHVVDHHEAH